MTTAAIADRAGTLSVFISHGGRDAGLAKRIDTELKKLGLHAASAAPNRSAGAEWRASVQAAITRSDAMIIVASAPQSLSSGWTSYETGVAEALGKPVILLLPSRYPMTEVPEDFASIQVVDFDPQAPERAAREIAWRLEAA